MAGLLTKFMIATILLTAIFTVLLVFMADMGNKYGISQDDLYVQAQESASSQHVYARSVAYNSSTTAEGSEVDKTSQDLAQVRSQLAAQQTALNMGNVLSGFIGTVNQILPFNSIILNAIGLIIVIILAAGLIFAFLGRSV